jgi:hypothetical protein
MVILSPALDSSQVIRFVVDLKLDGVGLELPHNRGELVGKLGGGGVKPHVDPAVVQADDKIEVGIHLAQSRIHIRRIEGHHLDGFNLCLANQVKVTAVVFMIVAAMNAHSTLPGSWHSWPPSSSVHIVTVDS